MTNKKKLVSCLLLWFAGASQVITSAYAGTAVTRPDGDPGLRSSAVLITDINGQIVYARNPAEVRSIASLTKVMTAMVVLDAKLDMEEPLEITREDRDLIKLTGSRLGFGATLSRGQLLHLALMASENRAASALGRHYPGGTATFVAAMNGKAQALGMTDSRFSDPAGLDPGNRSTAKDLALMISAAYDYPEIRQLSTASQLEVYPYDDRGPLRYVNTNRSGWPASMYV